MIGGGFRREERTVEQKRLQLTIQAPAVHKEFSRRLFGLFFENLGSVLQGGLLATEGDGHETVCGMRRDVLDALKAVHIRLVRLPGGDYADNYHWMDGIGEPANRPKRYNGNWKINEDNRFGTHEFIALCEYLEADPHFVVNVGTGSVEEARAWIEYCNHPCGTELSELRKRNGREKPFNVRLWAVGNEPFNRGGLMRAEYYADQYRNYAYFMRLMDPTIELILPAAFTEPFGWDERVLELVCRGHRAPVPEHISVHAYWGGDVGNSWDYSGSQYYEAFSGLERVRERLHTLAGMCDSFSGGEKKIRLSVDEYACWYPDAKDPALYQHCTLRDSLIAARMLQYVAMMGDSVSMLCVSEGINALLALIFVQGAEMCLTPAYYAYKMLSEHIGGEIQDILAGDAFHRTGPRQDIETVTVLATQHRGRIVISMVNVSLVEDIRVDVRTEKPLRDVKVSILSSYDVHDENVPGCREKVRPLERQAVCDGISVSCCLPKHSIVLLTANV